MAYCHNAGGAYAFRTLKGTPVGCGPTSILWQDGAYAKYRGAPSYSVGIGRGKLLGSYRSDGFTDGINTFQGVRTMDSNAGTWTTPDAFAGRLSDPHSQKSYMWNRNDAAGYSDPSGFDSLFYDWSDTPDVGSVTVSYTENTATGERYYDTADMAAIAANEAYSDSPNGADHHDIERGTSIYQVDTSADSAIVGKFNYTKLGSGDGWGTSGGWVPADAPPNPAGTHVVGYWHVHPPDRRGNTSHRGSMIGHADEAREFGQPIYTGFSDLPGVVFLQPVDFKHDDTNDLPPILIHGKLGSEVGDPCFGACN